MLSFSDHCCIEGHRRSMASVALRRIQQRATQADQVLAQLKAQLWTLKQNTSMTSGFLANSLLFFLLFVINSKTKINILCTVFLSDSHVQVKIKLEDYYNAKLFILQPFLGLFSIKFCFSVSSAVCISYLLCTSTARRTHTHLLQSLLHLLSSSPPFIQLWMHCKEERSGSIG